MIAKAITGVTGSGAMSMINKLSSVKKLPD